MATVSCRICAADTDGFICRACLAELRQTLLGRQDQTAIGWQSLRAELSNVATRQTRVYRANGADLDSEQRQRDRELDVVWRGEQEARERRITPAHRTRADRVALPSTRSMVNLTARDLLAESDNLLVTWVRVLHERTGEPWFPHQPRLGPTHEGSCDHEECRRLCGHRSCIGIINSRIAPAITVDQVLTWLTDNLETVRFHEAADVLHAELTAMHRRMVRLVDRSPSRVYAGPCSAQLEDGSVCPRPLYAWPARRRYDDAEEADEPIVCDGYRPPYDPQRDPTDHGCGTEHDRQDRREWLLADLEDRLLPLSVLEDVLPDLLHDEIRATPRRGVVQSWVSRGLLSPRTVIDGVEFFRGGDMVRLMIAYKPHAYAPRRKRTA